MIYYDLWAWIRGDNSQVPVRENRMTFIGK